MWNLGRGVPLTNRVDISNYSTDNGRKNIKAQRSGQARMDTLCKDRKIHWLTMFHGLKDTSFMEVIFWRKNLLEIIKVLNEVIKVTQRIGVLVKKKKRTSERSHKKTALGKPGKESFTRN
jgi:hypothetical protein